MPDTAGSGEPGGGPSRPPVTVRPATPDDAQGLLDLQLCLDRETSFMLLSPGERPRDTALLRTRLEAIAQGADPAYVIVADTGARHAADRLAGYVDVSVLPFQRSLGTGYVVMGVRQSFGGQGVGRALMAAAIDAARETGMTRLELTVMEHNRPALGLYLACGFQIEGLRRESMWVDGHPVSEYWMGLVLG